MTETRAPVTAAGWTRFRRFTPARIAIGRAGHAQPTSAQLAFQLDHARARDAVYAALDVDTLQDDLRSEGLASMRMASAAPDRSTYLLRPDLGRRPASGTEAAIRARAFPPADVAFVLADGLSAMAAQTHALPLLRLVVPDLRRRGLAPGPVILAEQARVALGDPVGAWLGVRIVVVLIGERPGLGSPDSLGVYLTRDPRPGRTDAERNCISNIRPAGLAYGIAAHRLLWLLEQSLRLGISGVGLKEAAPALPPTAPPLS